MLVAWSIWRKGMDALRKISKPAHIIVEHIKAEAKQ
jgi:hypothetical protein